MKSIVKTFSLIGLAALFTSCDMGAHIAERSRYLNNLEDRALDLSKENRALRVEISSLQSELNSLKNKNHYLKIQLDKINKKGSNGVSRSLASVKPITPSNDLVKFDIYKWKPAQVLKVAETEFDQGHYKKSAQFFKAYADNFNDQPEFNDSFLFQAGIASFESKGHYDWAIAHFNKLIEDYPSSKFFRGAKLWRAMAFLKMGQDKQFFKSVEEFRKKYRNTPEWKILSTHYEKIIQKHKKN
jgi:TolA-binding protein